MRDIALANHPRMNLTHNTLREGHYRRDAGAHIRNQAVLTAGYEHSGLDYNRVENNAIPGSSITRSITVDDQRSYETGTLGLGGTIPTAGRKAQRLHNQYWEDNIQAMKLARDARAVEVARQLEEAYMDFLAAQRDYQAKQASRNYHLEALRVVRLQQAIAPAETEELATDLSDQPDLTRVRSVTRDALASSTARYEYLLTVGKSLKVQLDLGQRMANIWREMGRSYALPEVMSGYDEEGQYSQQRSIWLWYTKEVLEGDFTLTEFMDTMRANQVTRIYTYLYSDARLLTDIKSLERFTLFVNQCAEYDIEVWALLGEPEWIKDQQIQPLETAISRIREFNQKREIYETRIAGVKLDLEPHSITGWDSDEALRETLNVHYVDLLKSAEKSLEGSLPLWADVPVKFFKPEHVDLLTQIKPHLDGVTLMAYFNSENAVKKWAGIAQESFNKSIEIGLELSANAVIDENLSTLTDGQIEIFITELQSQFQSNEQFRGIALHDYSALKKRRLQEK